MDTVAEIYNSNGLDIEKEAPYVPICQSRSTLWNPALTNHSLNLLAIMLAELFEMRTI